MTKRTDEAAAIYERLILALKSANLPTTQTWIADQLGIFQSAVSKWKSGESFPSYPYLVRLSQIASCSVGWLLSGTGQMRGDKVDDELRALLEIWDSLPQSVREEVLNFAKFRAPQMPPNQAS